MVYVTKDLRKRNKARAGCPDIRSVERTGSDTFVAKTHGKDIFEGKFNPLTHRIVNGKITNR